MTIQLELFPRDAYENLFPYWRASLRQWLKDVWMFRHNRNTTGWSMARQGFQFARCLLIHGQISKAEFRRWQRLERRVKRWDSFANVAVSGPAVAGTLHRPCSTGDRP